MIHIILLLILLDIPFLLFISNWYPNVQIDTRFLIGASIVYTLLALGLTHSHSIKRAALFGLISYGVYSFTNYGINKDWPFPLAVFETVWGGVLTGLAYKILN